MSLKSLAFLLFAGTILAACTSQPANTIEGKITGAEAGDRIILSADNEETGEIILLDSTVVGKGGRFSISTSATDIYVKLSVLKPGEELTPEKRNPSPNVFLDGFSTMEMIENIDDFYFSDFTGGIYSNPDIAAIREFSARGRQKQAEAVYLGKANRAAGKPVEDGDYNVLLRESREWYAKADSLESIFVKDNPDVAYSAALLMYDHQAMKEIDKYEEIFTTLTPRIRNTQAGKAIASYIANVRATEVGAMAPDFTAKTRDGDIFTLSAQKGKYVLLDFWGSWCGPCRISSPKLVELYNGLREKGANIEFAGIALDETNRGNWVKAIESDKLAWIQINDADYEGGSLRTLYAIQGVPTCFLISPEGKIVLRKHPVLIIPEIVKMYEKGELR